MAMVDTAMRPENTPETRSHYIDAVNLPWEKTKFPGIAMKVLYSDPASGLSTILFRLDPGAEVPLHEHTALEQTYMIEGRLVDHEGECTPGNFVWRPGGSRHIARAPEGAVLLSMFMTPNRFAQGQRFFTEK
ncbi:MAG: cupin domain-containing protein [Alphaproteobacteria bacterium]